MNAQTDKLKTQLRKWIALFVILLILSGITAFPLVTEINFVMDNIFLFPSFTHEWIKKVHMGITETDRNFPFLNYGTDWLAFAHIAIGVAFIGPYINPVKNIWIIEWAMICCLLVFPLALIAGHVRHIPFFHQLIDCSFGIFGLIPLYIVWKKIKQLEKLN